MIDKQAQANMNAMWEWLPDHPFPAAELEDVVKRGARVPDGNGARLAECVGRVQCAGLLVRLPNGELERVEEPPQCHVASPGTGPAVRAQAELTEEAHKAREAAVQARLEETREFQRNKLLREVQQTAEAAKALSEATDAKVDAILAELRRLSERPNGPVELRDLTTALPSGFKAFPA